MKKARSGCLRGAKKTSADPSPRSRQSCHSKTADLVVHTKTLRISRNGPCNVQCEEKVQNWIGPGRDAMNDRASDSPDRMSNTSVGGMGILARTSTYYIISIGMQEEGWR